jgi:hypothetical protein
MKGARGLNARKNPRLDHQSGLGGGGVVRRCVVLAVSNNLGNSAFVVGGDRLFCGFSRSWLWLRGASEGIGTLSPAGTTAIAAASGAFTISATSITTAGCL